MPGHVQHRAVPDRRVGAKRPPEGAGRALPGAQAPRAGLLTKIRTHRPNCTKPGENSPNRQIRRMNAPLKTYGTPPIPYKRRQET